MRSSGTQSGQDRLLSRRMEDGAQGKSSMVGLGEQQNAAPQTAQAVRAQGTPSTESEDASSSFSESSALASVPNALNPPVRPGLHETVASETEAVSKELKEGLVDPAQVQGSERTDVNGKPTGQSHAAENHGNQSDITNQLQAADPNIGTAKTRTPSVAPVLPDGSTPEEHSGISLRPRPKRAAAPSLPNKPVSTSKKDAGEQSTLSADFVPADREERAKLHDELLQRMEALQEERRRIIDIHSRQIMAAVLARHQAGAVYMPTDSDTNRSKGKTSSFDTAVQQNEGAHSQVHSTDAASEGPRPSTGGQGVVGGTLGSPTISSSGRLRTPSQRFSQQPGERLDGTTILRRFPQMRFCARVLKEIMKMKEARAFLLPVDKLWNPDAIPDYFEIIKQPMDLGTVRQKLESGEYGTDPEAFRRDVRLVWSNAMTYNPPDSEYYNIAKMLNEAFERKMQFLPPPGEIQSTHSTSHHAVSQAAARKRQRGLAAAFRQGSHAAKARRGGVDSALARNTERRRRSTGRNASQRPYTGEAPGYGSYVSGANERGPHEGTPVRRSRKRMDPFERVRELEQRLAALQKEKREAEALLSTASTSGRGVAASPPVSAGGLPSRDAIASLAKVPVTQQEMAQLAEDIGRLDGQQLRRLVELFGSRPGLLTRASSGEYEMNIQQASNETLRELQAFCNECLRPVGRDLDPLRTMSPTAAGARVASINRMLLKLNHELERARKAAANAQRQRDVEHLGAASSPYFAAGSTEGRTLYNGAGVPASGHPSTMPYAQSGGLEAPYPAATATTALDGGSSMSIHDHANAMMPATPQYEMNGSDESSTEQSLTSDGDEY